VNIYLLISQIEKIINWIALLVFFNEVDLFRCLRVVAESSQYFEVLPLKQ